MLNKYCGVKLNVAGFEKENAPAFRANQLNKNCFAYLIKKSHATEKLKRETSRAFVKNIFPTN
jgi:hypothetical protein